jgi:hypothetical protein
LEGFALQVLVVHRQGDAPIGIARMFKDVMAAGDVVNKKTCSLKRPKDSLGLASGYGPFY